MGAREKKYHCPRNGCDHKDYTPKRLQGHILRHHDGNRVECSLKCGKLLKSDWGAKIHAEKAHDKANGAIHPCPGATELGCTLCFTQGYLAQKHYNDVHLGLEAQCPECEADVRLSELPRHLQSVHKLKRLPCLAHLAGWVTCTATSTSPTHSREHLQTHDADRVQFDCPKAEEFNCSVKFVSIHTARKHGERHESPPEKVPCPTCGKLFTQAGNMRVHQKMHDAPPRGRFPCLRRMCYAFFDTAAEALEHSFSAQHKQAKMRVCTVPMCMAAVSEMKYVSTSMKQHIAGHAENHDMDSADLVKLVDDTPTFSNTALWRDIYQNNSIIDSSSEPEAVISSVDIDIGDEYRFDNDGSASDNDGSASDDEDAGDVDDDEEEEECPESFFDIFEGLALNELGDDHERRRLTERKNRTKWERKGRPPVNITSGSLGRTCIGSSLGPEKGKHTCYILDERCPDNVVLDFDTALIGYQSASKKMNLKNRCVTCQMRHNFNEYLRQTPIARQYAEGIRCMEDSCEAISYATSGRCEAHLSSCMGSVDLSPTRKSNLEFVRLLEIFLDSTKYQWKLKGNRYPLITEAIAQSRPTGRARRNKTSPHLAIVVLDTEFSPASKQVWEISAIDFITGKTIIDCLVSHDTITHRKSEETPFSLQNWSQRNAARIYSPSRTGISRMSVAQIADTLERAGITKQTVVVVYGKNCTDLRYVQKLLATIGRGGFLPSNEKCVMITHELRNNLERHSQGTSFTINLEKVFPILYPGHDLVGLNHQALVDCQQTRLVALAMHDLALPPQQRKLKWDQARTKMAATISEMREKELVEDHTVVPKQGGNDTTKGVVKKAAATPRKTKRDPGQPMIIKFFQGSPEADQGRVDKRSGDEEANERSHKRRKKEDKLPLRKSSRTIKQVIDGFGGWTGR